MPTKMWLPSSAKPAFRCRVPVGQGKPCGAEFTDREQLAFERHVIQCAAQHAQEVHENSPTLEVMKTWDPEYEKHMQAVGERMKAEGRVETRPNER